MILPKSDSQSKVLGPQMPDNFLNILEKQLKILNFKQIL